MKVKKIIFGLIIILLILIVGIVGNISFAATGNLNAKLDYWRYKKEGTNIESTKNGYAINIGKIHPIFQILSIDNSTSSPTNEGINYYCLSAEKSRTWNYGTGTENNSEYTTINPISEAANYKDKTDYDLLTDTSVISSDFEYYKEIKWILDNCYLPKDGNEDEKIELLKKAGIIKTKIYYVPDTISDAYSVDVYTFVKPEEQEKYQNMVNELEQIKYTDTSGSSRYDRTEFDDITRDYYNEFTYPDWLKNSRYGYSQNGEGYYYKNNETIIDCVLPNELIESIQQAAIWYFTEFKDDIDGTKGGNTNYNCYSKDEDISINSWLRYGTETDGVNSYHWPLLTEYKKQDSAGNDIEVGKMYQSQANILYNYLVDSAKKAAQNGYSGESSMSIQYVNGSATNRVKDMGSNYVIGPMKITTTGVVTNLNLKVFTGEDLTTSITDFEIQDATGSRVSLSKDNEFYVSIPKTNVNEKIKITVEGKTEGTSKILWVNNTVGEQPIIEITKEPKDLESYITANIVNKKTFDLKLVKYISEINGDATRGRTITKIDSSKLKDGSRTTADYILSKDPLKVKTGEYVTYTLRVYNEAELDGYAEEITEDIPNGLEYIYDNGITIDATGNIDYSACTKTLTDEDKKAIEFNLSQGWTIKTTNSTTNRIEMVKTDYLSKAKSTSNEIKAFDSANDDGKGSGLSYKEVKIMLKVVATDPTIGIIRNEAAITKDSDDDRDSNPDEWKKYEDDEDYDNVILEEYDIALRKFIAAISSDANIEEGEYVTVDGTTNTAYTRAPSVDTTHLKDKTATTAIYKHPKDSLTVARESYVLYTIRVYNEGDIDAYASKITDHLPTYLDYVECEFNDNYGWTVGADGKTVSTDYLSSEKDKKNILKAFDSVNDDGKGSGLDYKDVQILCKVNKNALPMKNITNIAQITEYQGKDGTVVPKDRDSKPDNLTDDVLDQDDRPNYEGGEDTDKTDGYIPGQEDDDDFERIVVREFDLALLKYVSEVHVIEDGNETVTQTGNTGNNTTDMIPKVEINRKKLDSTIVKFVYIIKITNEGDIPGYATEITDYVPEGLKFYEEDNKEWVDEGNNVISTKALKGTLLNPGESATVEVTFRWINGANNLGVKTNYAEISEDYNEYDVPDRDSTPDNKIIEEDDMDYAPVLLAISTGLKENVMPYVGVGGISLIMLAGGIILIKKFVL